MGNFFTGDFEAVLEVSGKTLNRLAASMHQNAGGNPDTPSFPHSLWIRVGDDGTVDGVRGTLQAQIGVPQIQLVNGATDRFFLSAAIRAWFQSDPGTTSFPAYVQGTFRAEYHLVDIDPKCLGWTSHAADYLWIRVIPETVTFDGDINDDTNLTIPHLAPPDPGAEAAKHELVVRQIAGALAGPFEATPHPVAKRFRKGALISLANPAESAIALPLGITGDPAGAIASINNLFLAGNDFAFAIRQDLLMGLLGPAIAAIQGYKPSVHVHVSTPWPLPDIDTDYNGSLDPITIDWQPHGSYAAIHFHATGHVHTGSVLADATFTIDQDLVVNFSAGDESLWLSVGSRTVHVDSSGLGSGEVADGVSGAVDKAVKAFAEAACTAAQGQLDGMTARKQELITQLRTLDAAADAHFTSADFEPDGVVLRGRINLSGRHGAQVSFDMTLAKDGYSALLSWLPGGRIDTFEWTWSWPDNTSGAANVKDRFLLRRPPAKRGKWGMAVGLTDPLAGIDGSGTVCLRVSGAQIDSVSGDWVPVVSTRRCHRFGIVIHTLANGANVRPLSREVSQTKPRIPHPEETLASQSDGPASNALIVHVNGEWDQETALALQKALESTRREDAGLVLMVLFPEDHIGAGSKQLMPQIQDIGRELGLPTILHEDVQGSWAANLAVPPGTSDTTWRLVTPGGGISWAHQGRIGADELTKALQHCLLPAPRSSPQPVQSKIAIGARLSQDAFRVQWPIHQAHCPPPPFSRTGRAAGSIVVFVRVGSAASQAHLRTLKAQYSHENAPQLAIVVDGADAPTAARFGKETGFTALPDPNGVIADRLGIRLWPTTLSLDKSGVVSAIELGPRNQPSEEDEHD